MSCPLFEITTHEPFSAGNNLCRPLPETPLTSPQEITNLQIKLVKAVGRVVIG